MNGRLNRYTTKEELEKIKKQSEEYKIKMGWSKPETKPLQELSEKEFLGKLISKEL